MGSLISGFLLPFQSIQLLGKPGIRAYVIWPLLLNILVFAGIIWLSGAYFDAFMDEYLPTGAWWDFMRPVLWVLFALAYLLVLFYGFTLLANLLAAPFNAILSAKVEQHLTGHTPHAEDRSFIATAGAALLSELNKLIYFISRVLPLFLLFLVAMFVPGLNLLVSLLWVLFGCWFLALEYADYPMGNRDMQPKLQRSLLAKHRFKSLGFGAGITLMLLIPLAGFIAMPVAVVAATRYWVDDLQDANISRANNKTSSIN